MVAFSRLSRGDRQPAKVAAKTQHTQTNTKYSTTGTYVIPMDLTLRTATIQPHAETGRWARIDNANKCSNHLVSADVISLDPILNVLANVTVVHNTHDVTVVTSNRSHRQPINRTAVRGRPSMAATARTIFGTPMPQYLNALTIAANKVIADTGAPAIFIMDNAEVDNKGITTKPLKINFPDGTTIWSTHNCNIKIPGLPQILTGHIVPSLKIASLIGI